MFFNLLSDSFLSFPEHLLPNVAPHLMAKSRKQEKQRKHQICMIIVYAQPQKAALIGIEGSTVMTTTQWWIWIPRGLTNLCLWDPEGPDMSTAECRERNSIIGLNSCGGCTYKKRALIQSLGWCSNWSRLSLRLAKWFGRVVPTGSENHISAKLLCNMGPWVQHACHKKA